MLPSCRAVRAEPYKVTMKHSPPTLNYPPALNCIKGISKKFSNKTTDQVADRTADEVIDKPTDEVADKKTDAVIDKWQMK